MIDCLKVRFRNSFTLIVIQLSLFFVSQGVHAGCAQSCLLNKGVVAPTLGLELLAEIFSYLNPSDLATARIMLRIADSESQISKFLKSSGQADNRMLIALARTVIRYPKLRDFVVNYPRTPLGHLGLDINPAISYGVRLVEVGATYLIERPVEHGITDWSLGYVNSIQEGVDSCTCRAKENVFVSQVFYVSGAYKR